MKRDYSIVRSFHLLARAIFRLHGRGFPAVRMWIVLHKRREAAAPQAAAELEGTRGIFFSWLRVMFAASTNYALRVNFHQVEPVFLGILRVQPHETTEGCVRACVRSRELEIWHVVLYDMVRLRGVMMLVISHTAPWLRL